MSGSSPPALRAIAEVTVGKETEYRLQLDQAGLPRNRWSPASSSPRSTRGPLQASTPQSKRKSGALEFACQGAGKRVRPSCPTTFGEAESQSDGQIVELPEDSISAAWAPGVAAIAGNRIVDHNSQRLLSNTIAHQWFGSEISPATLNDAWITNGMSRYAELMYLEDSSGKTSFQNAIGDVSAGALAYDTEPPHHAWQA